MLLITSKLRIRTARRDEHDSSICILVDRFSGILKNFKIGMSVIIYEF